MALIECYECEKEISDKAAACPHCAAPVGGEDLDEPFETYYKNGQLREKATKKNGKMHGLWEAYYENGEPRWKRTFRDGLKHRPEEEYYEESGQLEYKSTYRAGEIDGPSESYYENGQLESKVFFKEVALYPVS